MLSLNRIESSLRDFRDPPVGGAFRGGGLAGADVAMEDDERVLLEKIAPRIPVGVNTLRRYLAACEFADRAVFSQREPKVRDLIFVENNFTGIETISRLDRIDSSKTQKFIERLKDGTVSTRDLKLSLSTARTRDPSSSTARRGLATARRIESRKGLQKALLSHSMESLPKGGHLYRGTGHSFIRAGWFARAEYNNLGYFFASAESRETLEAAVFAAEFGANFFFMSWLVVPADPEEILDHALHLLKSAGSRLGLLSYGLRLFEMRAPVPREPGRRSDRCVLAGSVHALAETAAALGDVTSDP